MLPELERLFELSRPGMTKIIKSVHLDMAGGLAGKESSLKMIPTYVEMPSGNEKGRFIALDLGGTNFRVLELTLKGGRRMASPRIMKFALEKMHINVSAELFFDFIADRRVETGRAGYHFVQLFGALHRKPHPLRDLI